MTTLKQKILKFLEDLEDKALLWLAKRGNNQKFTPLKDMKKKVKR